MDETVSPEEVDKLLDALDRMQEAFMKAFQHRPAFLHTYNWDVCKNIWHRRNSNAPIEKNEAIEWRKPDGQNAILGENKAREHIDLMIKLGFLEEYFIPERSKRIKYVRGTEKLTDCLDKIFSVGVQATRQAFGK